VEMVKHATRSVLHHFLFCSPAPLGVVLLSVDVSAGPVLPRLKPSPLSRSDLAIRLGPRLDAVSPCLLPLHPRGFPPCQTAAAHALPDAFLLAPLPVVYAWRTNLRDRGDAHSEHEHDRQKTPSRSSQRACEDRPPCMLSGHPLRFSTQRRPSGFSHSFAKLSRRGEIWLLRSKQQPRPHATSWS
jgi:hypothetical protein